MTPVKPQLALGPLDSAAQYLVYLSIVVLGVLLPLLAQKWRTARENRRLVDRTLKAIREEMSANRRRLAESRKSFEAMHVMLEKLAAHYDERWKALQGGQEPPAALPEEDRGVTMAALTDTAWEVARLSQALPLLPAEHLVRLTRVYRLMQVHEEARALWLDVAMGLDTLDLPLKADAAAALEPRMGLLARARATTRYHLSITQALIESLDRALEAEP